VLARPPGEHANAGDGRAVENILATRSKEDRLLSFTRTLPAVAVAAALVLAGCGADSPAEPGASTANGTIVRPFTSGIDIAGMDEGVRPQDDFYGFVNGGWMTRTEIPADRPRWSTFDVLRDTAELRVHEIIEAALAAREAQDDPDLRKVADLYASIMDEAAVEAAGLAPLQAWLERVEQIADHEALAAMFGELQALGMGGAVPLGFWVDLDFSDTERHVVYLGQGGLGMPDRDYYLADNERLAAIRAAYRSYVATVLEFGGHGPEEAAGAAERIVALETSLAERHWTRAARRDRQRTYNPVASNALAEEAPGFEWASFLQAAGIAGEQRVVLRERSYFPEMAALAASTPLETWREYLRFKLLDRHAPYLPAALVAAHFDFHGRTVSGVPEDRPRWKRAIEAVEFALGEAVGREYVARHFGPESKARMEALVANLKSAFRISIENLDWMSEATKAEAQTKLASFGLKIGYPDQWRDYSALEIRADDALGNMQRAARFRYQRMIAKLGAPVDRDEWFMTPQTVNAYYSPTRNEIVFPAAILQPPFFDPAADDAVNYGAIGGVIGHEISHGFDDQGRRTDGRGLLRDWWAEEDDARYRQRADRLVAQYNAFEPIEGMNIDGRLSLGENIGDLAGLTVAYRAYRLSLGEAEAPVIDRFTGDQRFFMGWAQIWATQFRDDALRRQLVTGPHSPGPYRVLGVLRNIDAFHQAFEVGEDDGMWLPPEERVQLW
jgi:putative endopeptidase